VDSERWSVEEIRLTIFCKSQTFSRFAKYLISKSVDFPIKTTKTNWHIVCHILSRVSFGGTMKIIIPGGSGQVGTILARAFNAYGHEVVVLSRNVEKAAWRVLHWDAETIGEWASEFENADVVINLAGRSVNCRYNEENRRLIMDSRVNSTKIVGEAIARCENPPKLWLQSSTATIYSHRFDAPNDDITGIIGGDEIDASDTWNFSIQVAKAWEKAANDAVTPKTRKVLLRSAVTLSPDRGGIFDVMLGLVKKGLGGTAGDGKQFVSWIHDEDFIRAIDWIIEHNELSGAINLASPNPLPNREFMKIFRESYGTKIGLPATKFMIEIGAIFMRTESELVLKSRRVVPNRLVASGFEFQFADWKSACINLCQRWRKQ
jgi:uncharacterized protein